MVKKLLSVLIASGLVLLATSLPVLAAGKTHEVKTEVVSVDAKAGTITIKDDKGEPKTVKVLGAAAASLKDVKAGAHVTLTCQDSEDGQHEGVIAIKVEKHE
jgi:hypothetical protein